MVRVLAEGFPRSGNAYLYKLLLASFPNDEVIEFSHSVKKITPQTMILIRNPKDSISSFMSLFQEFNLTSSEQWWLRFYNTVSDKINPERWIFFEDLINETEQTVERIGNMVGITPIKIDYSKLSKNASLKSYPLYSFDKAEALYTKLQQERQK
jgi:hypothetical protein